jgi:hypothetical protein
MNDTRWLPIARLKRRLGVESITLTEGDAARMETALRAAQSEIESATGRHYVPVYKTISHWAQPWQTAIPLRDDLFELTAIYDSNGMIYLPSAVTWNSGVIALNTPHAFAGGEVRVTGLWGFHPAPEHAFRDSTDALASSVTADDTTLTVSNAAGTDAWGDTPRFAAGDLLRIDDELLRVTAVAENTLTVRRAENGTTAAAHAADSPIGVYIPGFLVESLGLRLASWLYREPDAEHGRHWPNGIERGLAKLRRERI